MASPEVDWPLRSKPFDFDFSLALALPPAAHVVPGVYWDGWSYTSGDPWYTALIDGQVYLTTTTDGHHQGDRIQAAKVNAQTVGVSFVLLVPAPFVAAPSLSFSFNDVNDAALATLTFSTNGAAVAVEFHLESTTAAYFAVPPFTPGEHVISFVLTDTSAKLFIDDQLYELPRSPADFRLAFDQLAYVRFDLQTFAPDVLGVRALTLLGDVLPTTYLGPADDAAGALTFPAWHAVDADHNAAVVRGLAFEPDRSYITHNPTNAVVPSTITAALPTLPAGAFRFQCSYAHLVNTNNAGITLDFLDAAGHVVCGFTSTCNGSPNQLVWNLHAAGHMPGTTAGAAFIPNNAPDTLLITYDGADLVASMGGYDVTWAAAGIATETITALRITWTAAPLNTPTHVLRELLWHARTLASI